MLKPWAAFILLNSGDCCLHFLKPLFTSCYIFYTPHFPHQRSTIIWVGNRFENFHVAIFLCSAHSRACPFPPTWSACWAPKTALALLRLFGKDTGILRNHSWPKINTETNQEGQWLPSKTILMPTRLSQWMFWGGISTYVSLPPRCGCSLRGCCSSWVRLCNQLELRITLLTEGST